MRIFSFVSQKTIIYATLRKLWLTNKKREMPCYEVAVYKLLTRKYWQKNTDVVRATAVQKERSARLQARSWPLCAFQARIFTNEGLTKKIYAICEVANIFVYFCFCYREAGQPYAPMPGSRTTCSAAVWHTTAS